MKHTRSLLFFAASLLGSAVLTAPSLSDAGQRWHATVCYPQDVGDFAISNGAALANTTGSVSSLYCPVGEDTDVPKTSINQIFIRGYDGNNVGSVSAMACTANLLVTGGNCGAVDATGVADVGNYLLQPSLNVWHDPANASDYLYLKVTLPPWVGGPIASNLRGFSVTE